MHTPSKSERRRPRLLALDLDGTLLDGAGALRPTVRRAVEAARHEGLEVVVCTGRRFRTASPHLEALDLAGPAVVQNGVLVKEAQSGRTLRHRYLDRGVFEHVLALMREVGPPLAYVDQHHEGLDFYTEREADPHPFQLEYVQNNEAACGWLDTLEALPTDAIVMLSCMADEAPLLELRGRLQAELAGAIRTNFLINKNYQGFILEAVSAQSGKWSALVDVAQGLGIEREEIAAIGDDENDVEMIAGAGLGIAMANAIESAQQAADVVTTANEEDGVVVAIERLLSGEWPPQP